MTPEFDLPFPHYRCPKCDKDLPVSEARMTVTCGEHTERERLQFSVRRAGAEDRRSVELICDRALGETDVDVFGSTFDVIRAVNLVAETGGEFAGMLSLVVDGGEAAVIFMSVYPQFQGTGVGAALLKAADEFAIERNLPFLRTACTNDDVPLLYFYQRHGFVIYEVAVGQVADRFGSATPGFSEIPVRDEIRFRRAVTAG